MSAKRPWYADKADQHAASDWLLRRRWVCKCDACAEARRDWYEPSAPNFILDGEPTR